MPLRNKTSISKMELTEFRENETEAADKPVIGLSIVSNEQITAKIEDKDVIDAGEDAADVGFKDLESTGAPNIYVGKRNFIHQLMDVALLMANVSQLKSLLTMDQGDKYYYMILAFICCSIVLQVLFTISMLIIFSIERKLQEHQTETPKENHPLDDRRRVLAERLDKFGNVLVLLIIVSNVFITGFGVEEHGLEEDTTAPIRETFLMLSNGTKIKL